MQRRDGRVGSFWTAYSGGFTLWVVHLCLIIYYGATISGFQSLQSDLTTDLDLDRRRIQSLRFSKIKYRSFK